MPLPEDNTRYLFFTGKGGVGKTSLSCATSLALAEAGKRVLIVSTDPASNLDEVLETALGSRPVPVSGVSGLLALNIDPEVSARDYRERMVAPYRGILPAAAIASMEEQFSGACTVEIAAELSADDREAILLCDMQGMTQKDYARHLGLSLPAAKSRVQRARLRLRAQLAAACQVTFDEGGKVCCFVPRPPLDSGASEQPLHPFRDWLVAVHDDRCNEALECSLATHTCCRLSRYRNLFS